MSDLTVANTIRMQLGGRRFDVMTGASNFLGSDNSLSFRLPRTLSPKIRYVRITLTPADLYDLVYLDSKGRGLSSDEGVYNDQLQQVFTRATGVLTHL
jgi:hypothetical protein